MAAAFRYHSDWSEMLNRISLTHDAHGEAEGIDWGSAVPLLEDRDRYLEDYFANLKGSTLNVAGQPALSGAVVLNAGANATLTQSGQNITVAASVSQRPFSVYDPGTLAAAILQKLTVQSAFLSQIDAYFQTAPVGVSGISCANLKVSGATSGSLTLPFSTATPEYHLKVNPTDFGAQPDDGNGAGAGWTAGIELGLISFATSAVGQIGGVWLDMGRVTDAGDYIRVGIASNTFGATAPALGSIPWLTDTSGNPAYVDVLNSALPAWASAGYTFNLAAPVNVAQSTTYQVVVAVVNPGKTDYGTSRPGMMVRQFGTGVTGNISSAGQLVGATGSGASFVTPGMGDPYTHLPIFRLLGGAVGLALVGLVTVEITMTGTPATPGGNLNVALQL